MHLFMRLLQSREIVSEICLLDPFFFQVLSRVILFFPLVTPSKGVIATGTAICDVAFFVHTFSYYVLGLAVECWKLFR